MTEPKWQLKPYEAGDEKEIVKTLALVYPNDPKWANLDYWNWLYRDNPDGFYPQLICLALDGSTLAGHYAIIPRKVVWMGKETMGAQSLDTVTHPSYRRQGLFEKTAKTVYAASGPLGLPCLYGFAKGTSYEGFIRKLDWQTSRFLEYSIYLLDYHSLSAAFFRNQLLNQITKKILSWRLKMKKKVSAKNDRIRFDHQLTAEDLNSINKSMRPPPEFGLVHDETYYQWRLKNPVKKYRLLKEYDPNGQLLGFAIIGPSEKTFRHKTFKSLAIAELRHVPGRENIAADLLNEIIRLALIERFQAIHTLKPQSLKTVQEFNRWGFLTIKTGMAVIFRPNPLKSYPHLNPAQWSFSYLDTDHI